ncbi:MAG: hypothetical protein JWM91_1800 [Rhodospirillales bacterium]|nr:hypothetical protein [Rhodospirillales bacterium]
MTNDLRGVSAEDFWHRFESLMGAEGLLTYRYLGRKTAMLHGATHDSMRIRSDMRTASGAIMAAPLAIASAEAGGFSDVDSVPAPVTAALHILDDGRGVEEIMIRRSVIHTGRTMGFSQSEVVDAADPRRLLAISYGTGIKLGDTPPGFKPLDMAPEVEDSPSLPPLHAVFGARRQPDGTWELPKMTPESMSTSGSLHLGPIHVAFEAAATEMVARQAGTDAIRVEDWTVMFVARGTDGPFAIDGAVSAGNLGRVACRLSLRDRGRGDRVVASLVATFRVIT